MDTKQLKNFANFAREQMDKLPCSKEQIKTAFANGLMNGYAKIKGYKGVSYDDALVPDNITDGLSSDILSGEFVHVEVIGWLYQYFVDADRADAVDVIGGADIEGSLVTAATQVFTPGWIVKYLTDNSLGRYFMSMFGEDSCRERLEYYISTGEALPKCTRVENISFFDPCCGSGNILVYAFDVFMQMYTLAGVAPGEAAHLILEKNIFGTDIDETAVSLASFVLLAKAAEYDKDIFMSSIRPNIYSVKDSQGIGSLALCNDESSILGRKFDVVCTNPPYLGRIGGDLKNYLNCNMKPYAKDLFTAFIYRGLMYCKDGGYLAYLTPNVWMYLSSHKAVRDLIADSKYLSTLVQLEKGSFFSEASVDLCAFTVKNEYLDEKTVFIRPDGACGMEGQEQTVKSAAEALKCGIKHNCVYEVSVSRFNGFPGRIMAFFAPESISELFSKPKIGDLFTVKQGMTTGNNKKFVKYWYEVPFDSIGFDAGSTEEARLSGKKWFPYNKGGKYRKWYGNNDYVVMYEDDGREMKEYTSKLPQGTWVRLKSREYYFKKSVTWSFISSSHFGVRYSPGGSIFDVAGSSLFGEDLRYVLGFLSTKTAFYLLQLVNPTMNYQIRDVKLLPFVEDMSVKAEVEELVEKCIELSKKDWDSSELSWDFKADPLVEMSGKRLTIKESIDKYIALRKKDFEELKSCEARLNEIFADIYSMNYIIDIRIEDSDITVKVPDSKTCMENLLSYIAGCAFGRFAPDKYGVLSTCTKKLSDEELAEYARWFLQEYFKEGTDYVSRLMGTDLITYYKKYFCKKHFRQYRKRPVYTIDGDTLVYFKKSAD